MSKAEELPLSNKQRQWLLIGLAILVFVLCLCAALTGIPAVSQKLAGGPVAAPQLAPMHDDHLAQSDPGWLAGYLGYSNPEQMRVANQGPLGVAKPGSVDLWPAQHGVFIVGLAQGYDCKGQVCTFRLDMAGNSYEVSLERQYFVKDSISLKERQVRVFGYQQQEAGPARIVTARLIDRGADWWAWWQPAWVTVYRNHDWGTPVWVYSVMDRNPYSPVNMDTYGASRTLAGKDTGILQRGDRILLHGNWLEGKSSDAMSFQAESTYQLVAGGYVPVSGQPNPVPQPTVTLRPSDIP